MKTCRHLFLCLLLASCSRTESSVAVDLGGFRAEIDAQGNLNLHSQAKLFVQLRPDSLAWREAEVSYEMRFGSFRIEETEAGPWLQASAFGELMPGDQSVLIDLLDAAGEPAAKLKLWSEADGRLSLHAESLDAKHNRSSLRFACAAEDHFIGLGGQSFDVDHRGWSVPLWVAEDGISKREDNEYDDLSWFVVGRRHSTHTPMPMVISSAGWGLVLQTDGMSVFHLGSEQADQVRFEAWENKLEIHLFDGPEPARILEGMTTYVGRPDIPPAFAFAPWLDAMYGSDNVRRVAQKLRAEDIPSSVIWTEDWRGGQASGDTYTLEEDWLLDRGLYPDFELLSQELHDAGFKFLVYNNTFLEEGADVDAEAEQLGHCIHDSKGEAYRFDGVRFLPTSLVDLTKPAAVEWMKDKYRQGLEAGADGYMADFAEWLPTDAVLHSGEDARLHHNLYPVAFQRANKELFDQMYAADGNERLFFVRSAYLGSQALVSVVWAGDQQTDFSEGDGLPSVIPMGIGLGLTGFPYYGHDIGGYMSSMTQATSRECWFRWVSLGALSPVMRTHHGKSALANWSWESDAESTAHFRRWARLHIRLYPYLRGLAELAQAKGLPLMRPLALQHPEFEPGWTTTDQFMLGDRLYVAPIVEQGATSRLVDLPAGRYYPLLGTEPLDVSPGDRPALEVPLEDIAVFVPAGSVLVMLPEAVDSLAPRHPDSGVVGLDDVGDDRSLWLFPGGQSQWSESGMDYTWRAADDLGAEEATWNSQPVQWQGDSLSVTGNGLLEIGANGRGVLEVSGGAPDRVLTITLR